MRSAIDLFCCFDENQITKFKKSNVDEYDIAKRKQQQIFISCMIVVLKYRIKIK